MSARASIVIATRDRAGYLERALDSLFAQSGAPEFEIVLADNGSSDQTRRVVEQAAANAASVPVRYVYEGEPNRAKARNRAVATATGELVVFCDDDVRLPAGWLAAHAAAHGGTQRPAVVNGPILNVPSYDDRPRPRLANYSGAFLCTCNASLPRRAFEQAGGFDESFDLYGWEDTELGLRLRTAGLDWKFAWNAYLWHIKLPRENTLEVEVGKSLEKARMARRFLRKHPSRRARLATGGHALNLLRARYFMPEKLVALYAGIASASGAPGWVRSIARARLLDATYSRELLRALRESPER